MACGRELPVQQSGAFAIQFSVEYKNRARPFLKWIGGKTQLLPELLKRVPEQYGTYHEPFIGAGALFFALQPKVAHIGDANGELILAWNILKHHPAELIAELKKPQYANAAEAFYEIRSRDLTFDSEASGVEIAARMIYLNKTCFNGLYRVNKAGKFNSPYGKYENPTVCDEENIWKVAAALHDSVHVHQEDFTKVSERAVKGDFVFCDPPYIPLSPTSNFTSYTAGGFGLVEHTRLRDLALELKNRGVHVLLSNSGSRVTEDLYGKDFSLEPVAARRSVNSKGDGRGAIKEYVIS